MQTRSSKETVRALGKSIAELHQFSQGFKYDSSFIRYYANDMAMGALFTKNELRDELLSGYTSVASGGMDIAQLELLMFLNICDLYAFRLSTQEMHVWIREHIQVWLSFVSLC